MAAVALAFTNLTLRNSIDRFEATVFIMTVTTAAMASDEALHHFLALCLSVTILEKYYENTFFAITIIAAGVCCNNVVDSSINHLHL